MNCKTITVGALLQSVPHSSVYGPLTKVVGSVTCNSKEVEPHGLFAALKGLKRDGREFVPEALARGAGTILSHSGPGEPLPEGVTWVVCPRDREAFSMACAAFYQTKNSKVKLAGITGTNGKTTVAYLLRSIFSKSGPTGMLGTIEYDDGTGLRPAGRTTPEAHHVHRFIRSLDEAGARYGVMEVSSHAITQMRVSDVPFAAASFSNLTRDHLDYHGTLESYFQSKKKLFDLLRSDGTAVINIEDPYGARLLSELETESVIRVGERPPADVYASEYSGDRDGTSMRVATPGGEIEVRSALVGDFNRQNLLLAVATAVALGVERDSIGEGISELKGVPGRLELVDAGQPFKVFVDYAHTDDGLKNVLSAARDLCRGRLIVVFGCGGDRDKTKRPLMGAVAARLGDLVFMTSDNPRSENPESILNDVESGARREMSPEKSFARIRDRREAILSALRAAKEDDIVVIAGKGHEREQLVGERVIPFHDPTVARELLQELGWGRGGGDGR